jgi:hypothetical protein
MALDGIIICWEKLVIFFKVQEIIGLNVDQLIVNRNKNLPSLHTIRKSLSIWFLN